ncbi:MAG: molybdopterin-dependent oxidoreductase [bacterium]|nr:molybdopterin-dependent oxidoreductase [bacterium]
MTDNPSLAAHPNVEDWIVVRADGGEEVRAGKVEIGQGIDTAVALIVTGELGVPCDRVAMTPVSTGLSPDEGYTAGSSLLEHSGQALGLAAATLCRKVLGRALPGLGVDAADLETGNAMVRSRGPLTSRSAVTLERCRGMSFGSSASLTAAACAAVTGRKGLGAFSWL